MHFFVFPRPITGQVVSSACTSGAVRICSCSATSVGTSSTYSALSWSHSDSGYVTPDAYEASLVSAVGREVANTEDADYFLTFKGLDTSTGAFLIQLLSC